MIMNSWKSIGASECAPPLRMFIIGTGKHPRFAPAEITEKRELFGGGSGVRRGQRNAEKRVGAEFLFVRRAVEFDDLRVEFRLLERIEAEQNRRDRLVHGRNRLAYALAAVTFLVTIPQLPCFMFAGARAARDRSPPERAAFEMYIDLDRRVAARIENLARHDFV